MNATVNQIALADAAKLASNTADPKSPLEVVGFALLRFANPGLVVTATDLTTSIVSDIPDDTRKPGSPAGTVCVDARRFAAAVASLPSAEVTVSLDDKLKVTLKSGKATVSLAGRKGEDFPTVHTMPKGVDVPAAVFASAVSRVKHAMSGDVDRFPGVYFHAKGGVCKLVTADGHRLALAAFTAPVLGDIEEVTVPSDGLKQMAAAAEGFEAASFAVAGGRLFVKAGSVVVSAKLADKKAVPWATFLRMASEKKRHVIRVDRETLLYAARRAGMMTGGDGNLANGINLAIDEELTVYSDLGGVGDASTAIAIDGDRSPAEIRVSWRYLADALVSIEGDVVELDYADALSEVLIRAPKSADLNMIAPQSAPTRSAK